MLDLREMWEERHESLLRCARALAPFVAVRGLDALELRPGAGIISAAELAKAAEVVEDIAVQLSSKAELLGMLAAELGAWSDPD